MKITIFGFFLALAVVRAAVVTEIVSEPTGRRLKRIVSRLKSSVNDDPIADPPSNKKRNMFRESSFKIEPKSSVELTLAEQKPVLSKRNPRYKLKKSNSGILARSPSLRPSEVGKNIIEQVAADPTLFGPSQIVNPPNLAVLINHLSKLPPEVIADCETRLQSLTDLFPEGCPIRDLFDRLRFMMANQKLTAQYYNTLSMMNSMLTAPIVEDANSANTAIVPKENLPVSVKNNMTNTLQKSWNGALTNNLMNIIQHSLAPGGVQVALAGILLNSLAAGLQSSGMASGIQSRLATTVRAPVQGLKTTFQKAGSMAKTVGNGVWSSKEPRDGANQLPVGEEVADEPELKTDEAIISGRAAKRRGDRNKYE